MSGRPAFDDSALVRVLSARPATFTRADRVRLLAEVFEALVAGRAPSRAAALFAGGGGLAWLSQGGDLCRDFWLVMAPAGSHHTPAYIFQQSSSAGATDVESGDRLEPLP